MEQEQDGGRPPRARFQLQYVQDHGLAVEISWSGFDSYSTRTYTN